MKKIMLTGLALGLASVVLTSCEPEGRVYSEHKELSPKVEWLRSDTREFKVPITDNRITYDLGLTFRYASGYSFPSCMVKVTEVSPSGVEVVNEYDLELVDDNGDYIGEAGLDIWDSEHTVVSNKKYAELGEYTYVIEQNTPVDPLPYSMEVGIVLDKSK